MPVDRYRSIEDGPQIELRVLGSRFLGRALRIDDAAAAAPRVDAVRRVEHAASHHAWALRVGEPGADVERTDDDGEPAGTAGRPILGRLHARDVSDALVIVTRYFGGTKLGTGGLARAYGAAAEQALVAAPERTVPIVVRMAIECGYDDLGPVEAAIARAGDRVLAVERRHEERSRFDLTVLRSAEPALRATIVEATAGRAAVRSE